MCTEQTEAESSGGLLSLFLSFSFTHIHTHRFRDRDRARSHVVTRARGECMCVGECVRALTRLHVQAVRRLVSLRGQALHGQLQLLLLPAPELPLLVGADQGFHGKGVGSRAQSCGRSPPLTHFSLNPPETVGRGVGG